MSRIVIIVGKCVTNAGKWIWGGHLPVGKSFAKKILEHWLWGLGGVGILCIWVYKMYKWKLLQGQPKRALPAKSVFEETNPPHDPTPDLYCMANSWYVLVTIILSKESLAS